MNYGTLKPDPFMGFEYITDRETGKRLYKLDECELCGMRPWSFTGNKDGWACCAQHSAQRRERNDNEEAAA